MSVLLAAISPGIPAAAELSRSQQLKAKAFTTLNEGIEAYRKGETKRAIETLEQVTRVALNSFRAFYYLGLAYKADRQYTKAIEAISFAIELDPTHLQAHVDLGDGYLRRGDTEEALAEYHRSLSIQQAFAPAWDGLGRAAEAVGDDDKAVEHFTKAIQLNPGFPDASLNLGDLYLRRGKLREAVDLFLKAIAVRPDFAAAYNRLGVAYARQRLGNEAIAALRKAAELDKGNPWHPYTIGLIEMDFGDLSQATRDFDAAIGLDQNYVEAYVAKARLLRRLGDFEAAGRLLDEALERPSEDEKLRREVADLRDQIASEGVTHRDLVAKEGAGTASPDDLKTLSGLRASMGDYAGAAIVLERVIPSAGAEGEPLDAAVAGDLFRFGYYSLRAGFFERAESAFARICAARPGNVPALFDLGLSQAAAGRLAAAERTLMEIRRLDPKNLSALIALGNTRVLAGRFADAAEAYQEALAAQEEFPIRSRVETILKALRERVPGSVPAGEVPAAPVSPGGRGSR